MIAKGVDELYVCIPFLRTNSLLIVAQGPFGGHT